ncbi:hypothetical protein ROHU_028367 [Labeo rohita]|uniref:Uncharacterized protein n=1 Tax=Labeo rohita TaxID=84645 RepID=A0A498MBZ8_LABRO|nr:hypothetical protein ROHU_028367 [Labeo rohita]
MRPPSGVAGAVRDVPGKEAPFPGRPRRLERGGSSTRAAKPSTGRNSAETGPDLAKLGSPVDGEAPYPTPPGPSRWTPGGRR